MNISRLIIAVQQPHIVMQSKNKKLMSK